jgi:hypothetical protein
MTEIKNKNVDEEAKEIIAFFDGNKVNIMHTLESQFSTIYQRSQVLISLCGIIVSVTGFSGKTIVLTSLLSRILLITGLTFVLLSGILSIWGVIRFKWITQWYEENLYNVVKNILIRRNRKTLFFRISLFLLLLGLTLYVLSISIMLVVIN